MRDVVAGAVAGLAAFATVWGFLSATRGEHGGVADLIRRTPAAHGRDVVTVIVADFRGLDTLVEITVLLIAGHRGGHVAAAGEAVVSRRERKRPDAVVRVVARLLLGPVLVVAAA